MSITFITKNYCVFLLLFFISSSELNAQQSKVTVVRYLPSDPSFDSYHDYYLNLLKLALNKTLSTYGDFSLHQVRFNMVQSRAIRELKKGQRLDVFWTMTSISRERELVPIRVPLLKGMLGYRIFLIRREDSEKFAKISRKEQLNQFLAGQGHDWPDTKILKENGIDVVGVTDFDALFTMLEKRRIDYIPRGINEPWLELKQYSNKDFMVEPKLMLRYRAPVYFFVHKDKAELAKRIEEGLKLAIEDGSFEHLFRTHPATQLLLKKIQFGSRLVFELRNPYLTPETPLSNSNMWLEF